MSFKEQEEEFEKTLYVYDKYREKMSKTKDGDRISRYITELELLNQLKVLAVQLNKNISDFEEEEFKVKQHLEKSDINIDL